MKHPQIIFYLVAATLLFPAAAYSQDNKITTRAMNLAIVADTVALEDYIPVTAGTLTLDSTCRQPGISKQALLLKARLAMQVLFPAVKPGAITVDSVAGICTVNDYIRIYDNASYSFRVRLTVVAGQDAYKWFLHVPRYVSSRDELVELANFEAVSHPLTDLANSRQARKRERMRVLIDLNKRSWDLAVRLMDEMRQPMVAGF